MSAANSSDVPLMAGQVVARMGLGYGVAFAVGIVVLVFIVILASYAYVQRQGRPRDRMLEAEQRFQRSPSQSGAGEFAIGGLDEATLEAYPKIIYDPKHALPRTEDACSICLADYTDRELLRMLPDCGHIFHADCIDSWLRLHASCPMCRTLSTPTTPLSISFQDLSPSPLADHDSPNHQIPHSIQFSQAMC